MPFPADVERVLLDSGWQPGRRVEISATVSALECAGYTVVEPAEDFLGEFMGLRLVGSVTKAHFGPLEARGLGSSDSFAYSEFAGASLTPVGEIIGDSLLLVDAGGRVFSGYANCLALVGANVPEALTFICRGGRASWTRID
jgi:hypothetical protein